MHGVPVLVLANKQDLPEAVSEHRVKEAFDMGSTGRRDYTVQPAVATNATGLYEGLDWLATNIKTYA